MWVEVDDQGKYILFSLLGRSHRIRDFNSLLCVALTLKPLLINWKAKKKNPIEKRHLVVALAVVWPYLSAVLLLLRPFLARGQDLGKLRNFLNVCTEKGNYFFQVNFLKSSNFIYSVSNFLLNNLFFMVDIMEIRMVYYLII